MDSDFEVLHWKGGAPTPVSLETSYTGDWFYSPLIYNTLFFHAMQGLHFGELLLDTWVHVLLKYVDFK